MATKAEQFKAENERTHKPKAGIRPKRSKPGVPAAARTKDKKHAAKKATYALEETEAKKPTRKSTRKTANRSKADSARNITEQVKKDSPTARARKSAAKKKK